MTCYLVKPFISFAVLKKEKNTDDSFGPNSLRYLPLFFLEIPFWKIWPNSELANPLDLKEKSHNVGGFYSLLVLRSNCNKLTKWVDIFLNHWEAETPQEINTTTLTVEPSDHVLLLYFFFQFLFRHLFMKLWPWNV